MKLVYCVVFFVAVLQATALDSLEEENVFPDYWQDGYENFYDYGDLNNAGSNEKEDTDKKVEGEIHDFMGNNEGEIESFSNEEFDALADYQIEDNRSDGDSKENNEADDDIPFEKQPDDAPELSPNNSAAELEAEDNVKENNENQDSDTYDAWWSELLKDKDVPLPDIEEDIESSEEIQEAVNDDSQNEQESYVKPVNEGNVDPDLEQINENMNNNLQASDEFNDNDANNKDDDYNIADRNNAYDIIADNNENDDVFDDENIVDDIIDDNNNVVDAVADDNAADDNVAKDKGADDNQNNNEDDTPEKVLEDLSDDLDKLLETLDQLSDDDSDLGVKDDLGDNSEYVDMQLSKERYIMSLREDYENFLNNHKNFSLDESFYKDYEQYKDEDGLNGDYELEDNKESIDIAKAVAEQIEAAAPVSNESKVDVLESDEINDSNDNEFDEENGKHYYGNDGLVDDERPKNEDAELFLTPSSTNLPEDESVTAKSIEDVSLAVTDNVDMSTTASEMTESVAQINKELILDVVSSTSKIKEDDETVTTTPAEINVDDLNSSEYKNLMSDFADTHKDDIDMESEMNTVPIHITLSLDEPTVITSPNYPGLYPQDTLVEWIIDGPGMGIEMNLTHCRINGNIGDYLLVIPGATTDESTDGIIFSFLHTSEKKYRFMNVNRMFVRFKTHPSMLSLTGFSFSAKLMGPPLAIAEEDRPHESELVQPPTETLDLSLAGLTLLEFLKVKSEFKELVADMAEAYITDNNIDPGLNTTLEVTQIIRTAICNIRWPSYETCVEVRFGVPLLYAEPAEEPRLNATELEDLWRTYIVQEPYASRLRKLGITEYAIPDDHSILIIWLVIASGVVIATCLLGFALWRFNCFLDYTRMKAFSDTDSIRNEKRNLDLYPTPHQTLPPLYSENDYKWADGKFDDSARVDMGGFANKSYMRDNFFDLDSDEDVIVPHDRKTVISPRDVYEV